MIMEFIIANECIEKKFKNVYVLNYKTDNNEDYFCIKYNPKGTELVKRYIILFERMLYHIKNIQSDINLHELYNNLPDFKLLTDSWYKDISGYYETLNNYKLFYYDEYGVKFNVIIDLLPEDNELILISNELDLIKDLYV